MADILLSPRLGKCDVCSYRLILSLSESSLITGNGVAPKCSIVTFSRHKGETLTSKLLLFYEQLYLSLAIYNSIPIFSCIKLPSNHGSVSVTSLHDITPKKWIKIEAYFCSVSMRTKGKMFVSIFQSIFQTPTPGCRSWCYLAYSVLKSVCRVQDQLWFQW